MTIILFDQNQKFQSIAAATSSKGIPTQRFRKEVIRTGTYINADERFEITEKTLGNWINQFQRMKQNGVKVPIPTSHENDDNSEHNRGWVLDLFIEGQALFMVCELIGEDAIQTAARADVSLFSPPSFTDGKGNEYTRPITHVAMTTHPVVPGLSEFVPLAASLKSKETKMDLKLLGKALSLELDEKKAVDQITTAFSGLTTSLKGETEKRKIAEKELGVLQAASKEKVPEPDATLVSLAADNRGMKLAHLVEAGRITPAVRDKLEALYVGEDRKALVFSLKTGTQGDFDQLVLALAENDPVKLKEQTGPQSLKLSDDLKKSETNALVADAERRAETAKA